MIFHLIFRIKHDHLPYIWCYKRSCLYWRRGLDGAPFVPGCYCSRISEPSSRGFGSVNTAVRSPTGSHLAGRLSLSPSASVSVTAQESRGVSGNDSYLSSLPSGSIRRLPRDPQTPSRRFPLHLLWY